MYSRVSLVPKGLRKSSSLNQLRTKPSTLDDPNGSPSPKSSTDDPIQEAGEEEEEEEVADSPEEGVIRLKVVLEDKRFVVAAAEDVLIEELAKGVEGVYAELFPAERRVDCCLLLDEDAMPLDFKERAGDLLADGASVYAVLADAVKVTSPGPFLPTFPPLPVPASFPHGKEDTIKKKKIDSDFKLLISNTMGLQAFKEFCMQEFCVENLLFWLDVETYRFCEAGEEVALEIANKIYENYISQEGPLQINLNSEIRNAIPWPIVLSPEIFDEAQLHVYSMMKGHTYRRFLKSQKYEELKGYINAHQEEYLAAQIQDPKEFFSKSLDLSTEENGHLIRAENYSLAQRDRTLSMNMRRYWKLAPEPEGYYADKEKLTSEQRARRIQREKKLKKFFGDVPNLPEIVANTTTPRDSAAIEKIKARMAQRVSEFLEDEPMETPNSEIFAKKKRADKLAGFFGDKLPANPLKGKGRKSIDETPESPYKPTTYNNLSPEERKALHKRSQKLKGILGNPENLSPGSPGLPFPQSPIEGSGSLARRRSNYTKSRVFFEVVSSSDFPKQNISNLRESLMLDDDSAILNAQSLPFLVPYASNARSRSLDEIDQIVAEQQLKHELLLQKELRRRKLAKLQAFLGEHLTSKIQQSQNIVIEEATPLSTSEKKQQQKKIHKLEKVFGEMPPRELIISPTDPWRVKQEKSLQCLKYFLDGNRDDDIKDLVKTMVLEFDEKVSKQEPPEEKSNPLKGIRIKKFNKLNHFFGNSVNEELLLEQRILTDIQEALAEDIASDEDLQDLEGELRELQSKIVRRASSRSLKGK